MKLQANEAVIDSPHMRRMRRSFGFALAGLSHAWKRERNLRTFVWCYIPVLAAGAYCRLIEWEWIAVLVTGFGFMIVELLNTAVERLADALDHNRKLDGTAGFHPMLKAAKDVGAGASLVCLILTIATLAIVFYPYGRILLAGIMK